MTVSVCICTKDRILQLKTCVESILKGSVVPNEIIIINEGKHINEKFIQKRFTSKIKIIDFPVSNLSKGRNLAIETSVSDIICFTDDDCIVDPQWLKKNISSFKQNPGIVAIFGGSKPFQQTKNKLKECPCVFMERKSKMINQPVFHADKIGFGNNMSFRKEVFLQYGKFKTWLGAGSIGKSAEDAEFALRLLVNKEKVLSLPNAFVYHDRWLTKKEMSTQMLSYMAGEMACYGYFFFQGKKFARVVINRSISRLCKEFKTVVHDCFLLKLNRALSVKTTETTKMTVYQLWGLGIGLYYAFTDPLVERA